MKISIRGIYILLIIKALTLSAQHGLMLEIKPMFMDKKLIPFSEKYITQNNDTIQVEVFKFYITDVCIEYTSGKNYCETNSAHLINIEDESSFKFKLTDVPKDKIRSIRFSLGVDSARCVAGALKGDLDPVKGMYWAWNSGYINAKTEGKSSSCKANRNMFEFHIGGFMPPYATLMKIDLPVDKLKNNELVIGADLSTWFSGIDLKQTNSVMIPGKQALAIAKNYSKMFKIIY